MSIKVFQLYKPEASSINEIQDRFNISKDKNVIALADAQRRVINQNYGHNI